ncbi:TPA: hypothetical protein EYG96_00845 [Candidatus Gracilibacteria bacterium]|nr:hypothetical protein [Candidatus Peregrinibacteria bacterium]HIQ56572.1 hypothetical protein [Candidatus Gracilibacteria bacterium]HIQ57747.1 hypothetical protein [Candidatus Gracilibacteria bacterium]
MSKEVGEDGEIKRSVKDKLHFIVFGKYSEETEEDEIADNEDDNEDEEEGGKKKVSFFSKAKSFLKKKSKEKIADVKKNAKKLAKGKTEKIDESEEDDDIEEEEAPKKKTKKVKKHTKAKQEKSEPEEEEEEDNIEEEDEEKTSIIGTLKGFAKEEISGIKKFSKNREKNLTKQEHIDFENQEKLFKEKTHMTLLQAEKRVKKWNEEGKVKKVKAGVKMILEFFPQHEFRKMRLSKNNPKKINEEDVNRSAKKSLFKKIATSPAHGFDVSAEFLEKNHLPQENDVNDDERVFGAISYFPLLCFFVLVSRKDSAFSLYHAYQGFAILAIFLVSLPFYWILTLIPGMIILFYVLYIGLFGISIYATFLAWSGRYIHIPGISEFAMKLSGK